MIGSFDTLNLTGPPIQNKNTQPQGNLPSFEVNFIYIKMQHRCMKLLIRNGITTLHSEQETTEPATQRSVSIPQIYKHSYLTESTQSHALTWRGICFDPCCLSDPEQGFKYRASIQLNSVLFSNYVCRHPS